MRGLWLRWIGRDLRRRWLLITSIALVLALGTGTYAALLGTSTWRTLSNDASFGLLRMHDLEATLALGTAAPQGRFADLVRSAAGPQELAAVRERLLIPTQVVVGDVIATGQIVGAGPEDLSAADEGSAVGLAWVAEGRPPGSGDADPAGVLEVKFADGNALPSTGTLDVSGGHTVTYTGLGTGPEEFIGGSGFVLADTAYATVYLPLAQGQALLGAPVVNNVVLTLAPGTDRDAVQRRLDAAFADAQPPLGATVTTRDDETSYHALYQDIEGDEQFWTIISVLMMLGATVAAVNLTVRVVEGQRREIGIGMALGKSSASLAVRPFAFGIAIAVLGVVLGVIVGRLLIVPLSSVFEGFLPLPVWETPFVLEPFLVAAAIGVVVPLIAVAVPVRRAVRVEPVEAIRVGHLSATGGTGAGWAGLLRRVPLPGRSYWHIPVRNVVRTPRRTMLTAVGIGTAITVLVTLGGLLDSINETIDAAAAENGHAAPDRLTVTLMGYRSADDPFLDQVTQIDGVESVTSSLVLPASVRTAEGEGFEVLLEVLDEQATWTPTIVSGQAAPGLVLAESAAADLGVDPQDSVLIRHPTLVPVEGGEPSVVFVEDEAAVAGVHPFPMRAITYIDQASAGFLGYSGVTNTLTVLPVPGADLDELRRALFALPGVAAVAYQADVIERFNDALDELTSILLVVAVVTLILALLIAFNSASIAAEERRREHATMLAYGLPVGRILSMNVLESVLIGLLGTALGVVLGFFVVRYIVYVQLPQTIPDIGVLPDVSAGTVAIAFAMGVLAVSVAPLLTVGRLRRMDVPSTLRVVE